MSAVRKLAVEAMDNGLLAPELAAGIQRVKIARSIGVRHGELAVAQAGPGAPERAGYHNAEGAARPRHHCRAPGLRPVQVVGGGAYDGAHTTTRRPLVHRGPPWQTLARADYTDAGLGQGSNRRLDRSGRCGRIRVPPGQSRLRRAIGLQYLRVGYQSVAVLLRIPDDGDSRSELMSITIPKSCR